MFNMNTKNKLFFQRGLIREIIVIIAVIFILSYLNIDPEKVWQSIVGLYNSIIY